MTIDRDKITEIFCMADDFCHIYDRFIKVNGLAPSRDRSKRKYHREFTLSDAGDNCNFILKHSIGNLPGNSEVDVPLTYADYYYLEALVRYRKITGKLCR